MDAWRCFPPGPVSDRSESRPGAAYSGRCIAVPQFSIYGDSRRPSGLRLACGTASKVRKRRKEDPCKPHATKLASARGATESSQSGKPGTSVIIWILQLYTKWKQQ